MESQPLEHLARESSMRGTPPPQCSDEAPPITRVSASSDARMAQLVRTIEQEVIPRLMLAHRADVVAPEAAGDGGGKTLGVDEVRHFAKLMLAVDEEPAFAVVFALRSEGVAVDRLYLDLLAPTARYLGELWTEDLCSFTDVTVGLGRLQRVLRELSPSFGRAVEHPCDGRSVLLIPAPGEQHTFGLVMVGEFFRAAGWSVAGGGWTTGVDAAALVAAEWFDVVGFSLGAEVHLDALAESIRTVKHETCNRQVVVLVGGPLFVAYPEYVNKIGADGMTTNGREAPTLAERLIAQDSTKRATQRAGRPLGGAWQA